MLRGVRKAGIIACTYLLVCSGMWAAKGFVLPKAEHANTYASKDAHPNENVTIALDLYNTAPKN